MRPPSTRPGSRADQISTLVKVQSTQLGRGLTIAEIRAGWCRQHAGEVPESFTADVFSLIRRGVLIRVGGRVGSSLYAHPEASIGEEGVSSDAEKILRALRTLHKRERRPLATREVANELRRIGAQLESEDPNVVRKRLGSLAETRKRGISTGKAPKVRKIVRRSATGRSITYWEPARSRSSAPPAPASRADAVRMAIAGASEASGRPVSRSELRCWIEAHDSDSNAVVLRGCRLATVITDTVKTDADFVGDGGRIHQVTTPLSCHGGAPERYMLGPPTPDDVVVCCLLDALYAYQPSEEVAEIGALRRRAEMLNEPALIGLADTREFVLAMTIHAAVGPRISAVIDKAFRALDIQQEWLRLSDLSRDVHGQRTAELQQTLEGLRTVRALPNIMGSRDLRVVGEAGTAKYVDIAPLAESTGRLVDLDGERAQRLVERARRLPFAEPAGVERLGLGTPDPLSRLDRVDAVLACVDAVPLARTSVLVNEARALLGRVLRDDLPLRDLLKHRSVDPMVRRAAVVAIGLLGQTISLEEAVSNASNTDDTAAYILSTVLALCEEAGDRLREVDLRAAGAARSVTDDARRRFDGRDLICVVG